MNRYGNNISNHDQKRNKENIAQRNSLTPKKFGIVKCYFI